MFYRVFITGHFQGRPVVSFCEEFSSLEAASEFKLKVEHMSSEIGFDLHSCSISEGEEEI